MKSIQVKSIVFALSLLGTSVVALPPDDSNPESELCQGNYQTPEQGLAQLDRFRASYETLDQWQERARRIRQAILRGAELDPLPERTPLRPIFSHRREHDGYSVENVAFESLPGVFVTGSLYRPLGQTPPFAGVLSPHGHGGVEGNSGRFRPDTQKRAATLARMGAVVLTWDMVGYGELAQLGWQHKHPKALKQQLWNSIRALDLITMLGDVDPARIAVTGASGGATQSFLLTAVDDRIAVSVPVVQISAHFFGGCVCESGMPIHKSRAHDHETNAHETNNVEIAALAAPRPQLVISDGQDWTQNTPRIEFPYLRDVYALFGAESSVVNLHLADEGHDYGPSKRLAAYRFLAEHLGLSLAPVTSSEGEIDESFVTVEPYSELLVFGHEQPLPDYTVRSNDDVVW